MKRRSLLAAMIVLLPMVLVVLILVVRAPASPQDGRSQENAHRFVAAMEAYKAKDYEKAIQEMEPIAQSGVRNGALYYDLGNAYLKAHQLGRAILWYERALKLRPNDPDLRFNADYARSLTRDAPDDKAESPWRIFFFWRYHLSQRTVVLLALVFNLLFWTVLIARRVANRRGLRYAAMAVAAPAVIFTMTALFNYYEAAHIRQGIVLDEQVAVRSGLDQTSTQLFVLHAGTKIRVLKHNGTHLQIRFGKDKIGWIEAEAVGVI
jgi:tetratricopeptide (TPR) repeat protein